MNRKRLADYVTNGKRSQHARFGPLNMSPIGPGLLLLFALLSLHVHRSSADDFTAMALIKAGFPDAATGTRQLASLLLT